MDTEEIKRKLAGLWEKTTHHSKDIIASLFEYYFDTQYLEFKEIEGKIVCAICGIPYSFGNGKKKLKALYLIALSSEEGFRKKGLLSELLKDINEKAKLNFDFTFIVPPSDLMADYLGNEGYFSSFFILEERFTPLHDFKNDYILSLIDSDERLRILKRSLYDQITIEEFGKGSTISQKDIIKFILNIENKSQSSINLCHSEHDFEYIFNDNSLRKNGIFISTDLDGKITGVSFIQKEELKRIKVVAAYVSDLCSYYAILNFIKMQYSDHSLSVNTSDSKFQVHSLVQQTYAAANPDGGDLDNTFNSIDIPFNLNRLLQPMGMVRFLKFESVLEYLAENRSDIDFKLKIRDYKNKQDEDTLNQPIYIVKNGKLDIQKENGNNKSPSIVNLSVKEISELLLRKNDSSNLIMEAFGIPRLNLQFRLLPY